MTAIATTTPRPVERWISHFRLYTDEQLLNPDYALTRFPRGTYCKLCDRWLHGADEQHMAEHRSDLEAYRRNRQAANAAAASERLAEQREAKALAKGVSPEKAREVAVSGISPAKRAYNRITSLRYKLNHPEKSGRATWSAEESAAIQADIDQAVAAHAEIAA